MLFRIPWYSFRTVLLPFVCLCAFMLSLCVSPAHGVLTLTKTVSATTAAPGSTVTYTIVCLTDSMVAGATITDILPANVTYLTGSASGNATFTQGNNTLTWTLEPMGPATSDTVTFQVAVSPTATLGSTISNTATGTAAGVPTAHSNTATFTVALATPSLTLTKTAAPTSSVPGGTVTFTLAYGNTGNGAASSTILS